VLAQAVRTSLEIPLMTGTTGTVPVVPVTVAPKGLGANRLLEELATCLGRRTPS
jgi:hypothetical protein